MASHESWISYDLIHPLRLIICLVIVNVLCSLKPWIKFVLIYIISLFSPCTGEQFQQRRSIWA